MTERRVIAITGASAGIGAALALRATRAGYSVVAVGRNGEALNMLRERIRHETGSIATLIGDVRDSGTSKAVAELAVEQYGRLDVLVANAGIAGRGPLVLQTDDELMEQLETHIVAPITLIRACLPLLIASRGTVFVLGSGVGRIPIAGMGLYPASKAGLRSAARTLRNELKPMKIGLTYVDPGAVDTEFMHRRAMPGAPKLLLTSPFTVAGKILRAVDRRPTELNVVPWQTALLAALEHFPKAVDFALRHAGSITGAPVIKLGQSGATAFDRLRDVANHADATLGASALKSSAETHADAFGGSRSGATVGTQFGSSNSAHSTVPPADHSVGPDRANGAVPHSADDSDSFSARSANAGSTATPASTTSASSSAFDAKMPSSAGKRPPAESQAKDANTRLNGGISPFDSIVSEFHAKANDAATSVTGSAPNGASDATERPDGSAVPSVPSRSASQRSPKIAADDDALSIVLTPYMQRMRRQNLSIEMLRARVEGGAAFTEDEFALDWVGMPNKNERKLITDVCRACADGGLLAELGEKSWQGTSAGIAPEPQAT